MLKAWWWRTVLASVLDIHIFQSGRNQDGSIHIINCFDEPVYGAQNWLLWARKPVVTTSGPPPINPGLRDRRGTLTIVEHYGGGDSLKSLKNWWGLYRKLNLIFRCVRAQHTCYQIRHLSDPNRNASKICCPSDVPLSSGSSLPEADSLKRR